MLPTNVVYCSVSALSETDSIAMGQVPTFQPLQITTNKQMVPLNFHSPYYLSNLTKYG